MKRFLFLILTVFFVSFAYGYCDDTGFAVKSYPLSENKVEDIEVFGIGSIPESCLPQNSKDVVVIYSTSTFYDYYSQCLSGACEEIVQIEIVVPYPGISQESALIFRLQKEAVYHNCNYISNIKLFTYEKTDNISRISAVCGFMKTKRALWGAKAEELNEIIKNMKIFNEAYYPDYSRVCKENNVVDIYDDDKWHLFDSSVTSNIKQFNENMQKIEDELKNKHKGKYERFSKINEKYIQALLESTKEE